MTFLLLLSSGLFLGWSLGANDASNVFGTAVGSRMITFRRAAVLASVFVILGAVFQGSGGAETLNRLGNVDALGGAFTVSLCAGFTVLMMTRRGLPVSTTQAVVGAILGWSLFTGRSTDFHVLGKIVGSWISGPILGMAFAVLLFLLLRWVLHRAKVHVIKLDHYIRVGLIVIGAFGAYSLGANNIANVMGVFVMSAPEIELDFGIFLMDGVQVLFLFGGLAIALGIITYSKRVMDKVGNGILNLTPEAAMVVVLSHSLVLFLFSSSTLSGWLNAAGLPAIPLVPVSSTQVVVGAVMGIGLVKGVQELRFKVLGGIALGWVITPAVSGMLTFFMLYFVKNVFGLEVSAGEFAGYQGRAALGQVSEAVLKINMVLPGLFLLALLMIVVLIAMVIKQQRFRVRAENELMIQQNQAFVFQRALGDLELKSISTEKESLQSKLYSKRKEVEEMAISIAEQRNFLNIISVQLDEVFGTDDPVEIKRVVGKLQALVKQRMTFTQESKELYERIGLLQTDFLHRLTERFPGLSARDRRLATLIRIGLSNKEIGSLMNIAPKSVEIGRYRLKRKMRVGATISLQEFICQI